MENLEQVKISKYMYKRWGRMYVSNKDTILVISMPHGPHPIPKVFKYVSNVKLIIAIIVFSFFRGN